MNPSSGTPHVQQTIGLPLDLGLFLLLAVHLQKLDTAFASRPSGTAPQYSKGMLSKQTTTASNSCSNQPAKAGLPGVNQAQAPEGTSNILIELKDLSLKVPDPFLPLHKLWAAELATAQAGGQPALLTLLPPPQPYVYHFELSGCEENCSENSGKGTDAAGQGGGIKPNTGYDNRGVQQGAESMEGKGENVGSQIDQGGGGRRASLRSPFLQPPLGADDLSVGGCDEAGGGAEVTRQPEGEDGEQGVHDTPCRRSPRHLAGIEQGGGSHAAKCRVATAYASIPMLLHPPEAPVLEADVASKVRSDVKLKSWEYQYPGQSSTHPILCRPSPTAKTMYYSGYQQALSQSMTP